MGESEPQEMLSERGPVVVPQPDPALRRLLIIGLIGAAVALTLGIYANAHTPSSDLTITLGFSNTITMKVWLTTIALCFAVVQLLSALWMYGRLPLGSAPAWLGSVHRISGRIAFLLSLPVAYHCLYQLGFQHSSTRVLAPLDPRLPVLWSVHGEGADRPLPQPSRQRSSDRGRPRVRGARLHLDLQRRSGTSTTSGFPSP